MGRFLPRRSASMIHALKPRLTSHLGVAARVLLDQNLVITNTVKPRTSDPMECIFPRFQRHFVPTGLTKNLPSCKDCRMATVRCVLVRSRRQRAVLRPVSAYTAVSAATQRTRDERTQASCASTTTFQQMHAIITYCY